MSEQRARRLAERIQVIVAEMLERRIKDPRLGFVTVTGVRVTGDLREATVFYTVLGDSLEREASAAALASATGVIRSEVGNRPGSSSRPLWLSSPTRCRRTPPISRTCCGRPRSATSSWRGWLPGRRSPVIRIRTSPTTTRTMNPPGTGPPHESPLGAGPGRPVEASMSCWWATSIRMRTPLAQRWRPAWHCTASAATSGDVPR